MHSSLDSQTGNVGTHDGQRCVEILDFQSGEPDILEYVTGRTIRMAPITHAAPDRPDGRLHVPQHRSTRGGNVFNEDESASRSEHSMNFADCSSGVDNAAKNQRADYGIDGAGFDWQGLRSTRAQIHRDSEAAGFLPEVSGHVGVRLHSDPANVLARQVTQVCSSAGAYLQHRAGNTSEETLLVGSKVMIRLMPKVRHEPGEEAEADRAGSPTNFAEGGFLLGDRVLQCFNYTAWCTQPP